MIKNILGKAVATAGFLSLVLVSPASADTDIRVVGNGYGSDNTVLLDTNKDLTVRQSNDTTIRNEVSINNNTGHNSSNYNTGGDVVIRTGDAASNVSIQNKAGFNAAHTAGCGGCDNDLDVDIHGNGAFSDNSVRVSSDADMHVVQDNDSDIDNDIDIKNHAGGSDRYHDYDKKHDMDTYEKKNYVKHSYIVKDKHFKKYSFSYGHTGGDVLIRTGDAKSKTNVVNFASANYLK